MQDDKSILYICRHAISRANMNYDIGQTVYDVDLHDTGIDQAKKISGLITDNFSDKDVLVILSPLKRTHQTSEPFVRHLLRSKVKSVKIIVEELIRERMHQTSDLLHEDEDRNETWDSVVNRCNKFKEKLIRLQKEYDAIVVFSHHGFISMFLDNRLNPQNAIPIKLKLDNQEDSIKINILSSSS